MKYKSAANFDLLGGKLIDPESGIDKKPIFILGKESFIIHRPKRNTRIKFIILKGRLFYQGY